MTTQTEALKLALEALEQSNQSAAEISHARNNPQLFTKGESGAYQHQQLWITRHIEATDERIKAITAIKEALAQPEQEPVGVVESALRFTGGFHVRLNRGATMPDVGSNIYTTPPQRKPLTDEQLLHIYVTTKGFEFYRVFARAIEAAHGIKE